MSFPNGAPAYALAAVTVATGFGLAVGGAAWTALMLAGPPALLVALWRRSRLAACLLAAPLLAFAALGAWETVARVRDHWDVLGPAVLGAALAGLGAAGLAAALRRPRPYPMRFALALLAAGGGFLVGGEAAALRVLSDGAARLAPSACLVPPSFVRSIGAAHDGANRRAHAVAVVEGRVFVWSFRERRFVPAGERLAPHLDRGPCASTAAR